MESPFSSNSPMFMELLNSEGYHYHEPVDGEAAEIIAGIAAKQVGKLVCPKIRECRGKCMSIVNLYAEGDPLRKLFRALDIVQGKPEPNERYETYSVGVNCDHAEFCTPIDLVELPISLLKRDPLNCQERINACLHILDQSKAKQ